MTQLAMAGPHKRPSRRPAGGVHCVYTGSGRIVGRGNYVAQVVRAWASVLAPATIAAESAMRPRLPCGFRGGLGRPRLDPHGPAKRGDGIREREVGPQDDTG